MSWDDESWKEAARKYHKARGDRTTLETDADQLTRLRRLLPKGVSINRAWWWELNSTPGRAAETTVEALMFSLRERGTGALDESDTRRRLAELSDEQAIAVATRLQRLKPEIARAWSADEVQLMLQLRETLR